MSAIHTLRVTVLEGKDMVKMNLIGKSDPFCELSIDRKYNLQKHATAVIKETLAPRWNETFTFISDKPDQVKLEVFDFNFTTKGRSSMGKAVLPPHVWAADDEKTHAAAVGPVENKLSLKLEGVKSGTVEISTVSWKFYPEDYYKGIAQRKHLIATTEKEIAVTKDHLQNLETRKSGGSRKSFVGESKSPEKKSAPISEPLVTPRVPKDVYALKIHVREAKDLMNTDLFGKSDPYCVFKIADVVVKSKVVYDNLNPVWDESLFLLSTIPGPLEVQLFDEDVGSAHDNLGTGVIETDLWFKDDNKGSKDVTLKLSNAKTGTLFLSISYSHLTST